METLLGTIGLLLKLIIFFVVVAILYGIFSYNKLQSQGQAVKASSSTILIIIQKRADLINKLMDIAKDYGNHEKLIHISVSQNLMETFKTSSYALANVNSLAANYPELKANVTYQNLMAQINIVENELQEKREIYNRVSQEYNSYRLQIPTVFYSKLLGFQEAQYFDFDNMQELREFNTDDGRLLQEALSNVSNRAQDITQKGVNKAQEKIQQISEISEQKIKSIAEARALSKAAANAQGAGKRCVSCSTVNDYDSSFCLSCGKALPQTEPGQKICPKCSKFYEEGSLFCSSCGEKL